MRISRSTQAIGLVTVETVGYRFLFRQALFRQFLFRHAIIHYRILCNVKVQLSIAHMEHSAPCGEIIVSALYAERAIKHNRLVCIGGMKLAGLDKVSFDAIIHRLIVYLSATFMLNISETKRFGGSCPIADAHGVSIDDVIDDVT